MDTNVKDEIVHLRTFIKKASKHMPDRNNRGFEDGISVLNAILDRIESLLSYVDEPMLNYYKSKRK